jgi:hypothetical protein
VSVPVRQMLTADRNRPEDGADINKAVFAGFLDRLVAQSKARLRNVE